MNRKNFLRNVAFGAGTMITVPGLIQAQQLGPQPQKAPPLPADKVRDFVAAGHNNLEKVKLLLAEFPTLIYATWDLGGGDFETALEGAGHVGTKDVANYLIEKGARTNLFVLTMLGKTQIVKAYIEAFPSYLTARGPHGFTLLHHANRGGEDAKELVDYLQSKGLKETKTAL
ncbi:MAG: ankyrin repeat domain-containing protein [Bacteroidota bacterium]